MQIDRSGRVWAMRQDEVMIAESMAMRVRHQDGNALPPAFARQARPLDGSAFATVVDGVAVVPVRGLLLRQMSQFFWSYEEIARDMSLAEGDRKVHTIVLDIDSPGGMVAGCGDLVDYIRGETAAGGKPVEVFAGGLCASAAYWIAAAGKRITLGSGAVVGSIGTAIEYVDLEPMLERMGARIVRVVAEQSPNKRLSPHSPEGRAEMQAIVDASCADFVSDVAAGRGISEARVLERFGQGLVFGAGEALARGMADRRGALADLVAELAGRSPTEGAAPATAADKEQPMGWESVTAAALREHRAELVAELVAEAVAAERARLLAIDDVALAGHEELVATARRDGISAADLAVQILRAEKAAAAAHLANRARDDAAVAVPPAPPPSDGTSAGGGGTIEDRCRAAWGADEFLRAEFAQDFDAFLAFERADRRGAARLRAV